jgi:hypothetical protein
MGPPVLELETLDCRESRVSSGLHIVDGEVGFL